MGWRLPTATAGESRGLSTGVSVFRPCEQTAKAVNSRRGRATPKSVSFGHRPGLEPLAARRAPPPAETPQALSQPATLKARGPIRQRMGGSDSRHVAAGDNAAQNEKELKRHDPNVGRRRTS